MSTVKIASPGLGFDVNCQLTSTIAADFKEAGYEFVIRYIPRTSAVNHGNLSIGEIRTILEENLSLGIVQHCPMPGWQPSTNLGTQYGEYAAIYCKQIEIPPGINIWLDLEALATTATAQEVIDYANSWYTEVVSQGYIPGVYLGYGLPLLSPEQLYSELKFSHYWKAYNGPELDGRGYQIIQQTQKTLGIIQFDPDVIQKDNAEGLPIWLAP